MSQVIKTNVTVSTSAPVAEFTGDLSVETVTSMLLGAYPFLANSVASETITEDESGNTIRVIQFAEKTATKGRF